MSLHEFTAFTEHWLVVDVWSQHQPRGSHRRVLSELRDLARTLRGVPTVLPNSEQGSHGKPWEAMGSHGKPAGVETS